MPNRRQRYDLFLPGHWVHPLLRGPSDQRQGTFVDVVGGVITLEFQSRTFHYRNHDVVGLRNLVEPGMPITLSDYGILHISLAGAQPLSLVAVADPWVPCSVVPPATPEELAERQRLRRGYMRGFVIVDAQGGCAVMPLSITDAEYFWLRDVFEKLTSAYTSDELVEIIKLEDVISAWLSDVASNGRFTPSYSARDVYLPEGNELDEHADDSGSTQSGPARGSLLPPHGAEEVA